MRLKRLAVALLILLTSTAGLAQGPDADKVDDLATAISHAEGFGKRGTIPSRYHNPGDLRARPESPPITGQVRIGKAGHIVFKDDEAGKAALRSCIVQMVDGRSRHFRADMTLAQVARVYAENWRPWVKIVSRELGVPPTTTLRAYFDIGPALTAVRYVRPLPQNDPSPMPPAVYAKETFHPLPVADRTPPPPVITFSEPPSTLKALVDVPVNVPPLVEDAPQHRKLIPVSLPHPHLFSRSKSNSTSASYVQTNSAQSVKGQ